MATGTSSFNPYQAPSAPTSDASLAADTEFLFNDKVVAGAGTIVLPRVCVVTGLTEFLLARESRLWWCSRWITFTRSILILAALFFGFPMVMNLPPGAVGLSASPTILASLQLIVGAGLILGAIALVTATYVMRSSIQVRWFISRRIANRSFYFWMANLVLSIGVTIGAMFGVRNAGLGIFVTPSIWVFASVVRLIRGKQILYVADQQDGLFLIGGLSDKFLAETKRMADEYTARTGSSTVRG
ncbi:MAG: hypothetical protein H7Z17_10040 [Fuerstia sp.]|nr:hypothetical protein [Fuerstiella sp.]